MINLAVAPPKAVASFLDSKAKQAQCKTPLSDPELLGYHSSEDYSKLDYHFVSSALPKCLKIVDNTGKNTVKGKKRANLPAR